MTISLDRWVSARVLRRFPQLLLGVIFFGVGIALMAHSGLGLGAWAVLHEGIGEQTGLALGSVDFLLSIPILLIWLALRQQPGIGTVAAGGLIGVFTNLFMEILSIPGGPIGRGLFLLAGSGSIALGSGLYLSANLGPGPRDGLMTGIHQRFGWSIRSVRIGIELSVLTIGFALGGTVGIGTVIHAVAIGPMVQLTLGWWDKNGDVMRTNTPGNF